MSKRISVEPLQAPDAKRQLTSFIDSTYPIDPIINNADDDASTAPTPNSTTEALDSPATTAATTPRAKFPSDLKTLSCPWPGCVKSFNRPARLRDHLNSHTNSRPFRCPHPGCGKDYIEDKHLKQHVKAAHTDERAHVCPRPGCGKRFVTGTRLRRHQAVHEGADRFRCPDCGRSFRKRETLRAHVLKDHRGEPPHQCAENGCGARFESRGALRRHQQSAHGELRFWCAECAAQQQDGGDGSEEGGAKQVGFTTERLLRAHMKLEHQDCLFCDFKSASQAEMVAHIDRLHSGKTVADRKTIPCPHDGCSRTFTKKSNLGAHIRTAHEGFRFVCGEVDLSRSHGLEAWSASGGGLGCGAKFCTKVRLEDHVRYVHLLQERPRPPPSHNATRPTATRTATATATATAVTSDADAHVDFIDEISGVHAEARNTVRCPHCPQAFTRYFDLERHVGATHHHHHDADNDPRSVSPPLEPLFDGGGQDAFDDAFAAVQGFFPGDEENDGFFPGEEGEEEEEEEDDGIFAAEMHYGPPRDEWLDDEAGIMLLARDESVLLDGQLDPELVGFGED